jgi:hypothetical protein
LRYCGIERALCQGWHRATPDAGISGSISEASERKQADAGGMSITDNFCQNKRLGTRS